MRIAGGGAPNPLLFFHRFPLLPTHFPFLLSIVSLCIAPHPLLFFNRLPLLPNLFPFFHIHHRLFGLILSLLISIDACAYILLSSSFLVRIAKDPPPAFVFSSASLATYTLVSFHKHRFLGFIFSFSMFQHIHALRGERGASPLHPPHTLIFLSRLPLLPTIPLFSHKHHRLFGLISSLLISIEASAYVLLSWYTLRGEGLPPCTPPPAFIFKQVPLTTYSVSFFISIIVYLASFYLYCCPYRLVPMYFFHLLSWYALQGTPHPLLFFHRLPLLPTVLPFVHKHRFLGFIFSFFFFQNIHRDFVPMYFFNLLSWCALRPHPLLLLLLRRRLLLLLLWYFFWYGYFFWSRFAARNPWGLTLWHLDIFLMHIYFFWCVLDIFFDAFIFFLIRVSCRTFWRRWVG